MDNEGITPTSETELSSPSASNSSWSELTHYCLINILSRLTHQDIFTGPILVCKSWLQACKDPSLHAVLNLDPHFNSVTQSSLWWTPPFERRIDLLILSVSDWSDGNLSEIRVSHCSDRSLDSVAERCPKLQVLSIKYSPNVTDASLSKIASRCPQLRELDISYCYEISHESMLLIGRNCPNLKVLKRNFMNYLDPSQHRGIVPNEYMNTCPQDGDSEAAAIAKSMPHLEHLEIQFSKLSNKGLALISGGCPALEFLDLFGCVNISSRDVFNASNSLKNLRKIEKPNFYIPRSVFHTERYGHWQLYDDRFQTDAFRI